MKKILFIRHAKSVWNNFQLNDHDRPLSNSGKKDAAFIGTRLLDKKIIPEIFYCSSSKRTTETCNIIVDKLGADINIISNHFLYTETYDTIRKLIYSISEELSFISIVAHNPHIHNIYNSLCKNSNPSRRNIYKFPTGGIILCENDAKKWKNCNLLSSEIIYFDNPKNTSKSYDI